MKQESANKAVDEIVADLERRVAAAKKPKKKIELLAQICKTLTLREFKRCYGYAKQMLSLAEELQDTYWTARALYAVSVYEYCITEDSNVLPLAEKAAQIFHDLNEKELEHKVIHHIGTIYKEKGQYARALPLFQKMVNYWHEADSDDGVLKSLYQISAIYWRMGDYVKSLETTAEILDIATANNLSNEIHGAYGLLSLVYSDMGEHEKSVHYNLKIVEFIEQKKSPDRSLLHRYKRNIGLGYYHLGRLDEAMPYLLAAKAYFNEIGGVLKEAAILENIGMVYERRGELHTALEHFKQAEILLETRPLDSEYYAGFLYANTANVYMRMKDNTSEIAYLEKALASAQKANARKLEYEICLHISDAWGRMGDTAKAYSYHKRYATLKDDILNEEKQKVIAEMQARFEVETAEREKEIFRLKNVELVAAMEEIGRLNTILAELNAEKNKLLQLVAGELKTPLLGMRIAPE